MKQPTATLYDNDYHAWAEQQVDLLRQGEFDQLDMEHLIEEIEDMAQSQRRALTSRLQVLISHLLKWQFQPGHRSRSWEVTIRLQRAEIADLLMDNPSLRPRLDAFIERAYPKARQVAWGETGLDVVTFPLTCPFTHEQILNDNFFPDA
jgi:hypothetical protein